jgi:hypothetical protein
VSALTEPISSLRQYLLTREGGRGMDAAPFIDH